MKFPEHAWDDTSAAFNLLGDFWTAVYPGRDVVKHLTAARLEIERNNHDRLTELTNQLSRIQSPIAEFFALRSWEIESDLSLPEGVESFSFISYDLSLKQALVKGTDFKIVDRAVVWANDVSPIKDWPASATNDKAKLVWLWRVKRTTNPMRDNWGYLLQVLAEKSQDYKDLLNTLFDILAKGPSSLLIRQAYSYALGLPVTRGYETVEDTSQDHRRSIVITDQNVYLGHLSARPHAEPGSYLGPGESVFDSLLFHENGEGIPDWLEQIYLDRAFIPQLKESTLGWKNSNLPTKRYIRSDGSAAIEFLLDGSTEDSQAFWTQVRANGVLSGKTLEKCLSSNPNVEPSLIHLPAYVNPLQFLLEEIWRSGYVIVSIKVDHIDPTAFGIVGLKSLREYFPINRLLYVMLTITHGELFATGSLSGSAVSYDSGYLRQVGPDISQHYVSSWEIEALC